MALTSALFTLKKTSNSILYSPVDGILYCFLVRKTLFLVVGYLSDIPDIIIQRFAFFLNAVERVVQIEPPSFALLRVAVENRLEKTVAVLSVWFTLNEFCLDI